MKKIGSFEKKTFLLFLGVCFYSLPWFILALESKE